MSSFSLTLSLWVMLQLAAPQLRAAISCRDISKVDFRNFTFQPRRHPEQTSAGYNGPALDDPLVFHKGVAEKWYTPKGPPRPGVVDDPDWQAEISRDVFLPPIGVRVIEISEISPPTSAVMRYVFAFDCYSGKVRKLFEATGAGVLLKRVNSRELRIAVWLWKPGDEDGQPSTELTLHYRWSNQRRRYVRLESNRLCPWLP